MAIDLAQEEAAAWHQVDSPNSRGEDEDEELPQAETVRVQDMLDEFDEVNVLGTSAFAGIQTSGTNWLRTFLCSLSLPQLLWSATANFPSDTSSPSTTRTLRRRP